MANTYNNLHAVWTQIITCCKIDKSLESNIKRYLCFYPYRKVLLECIAYIKGFTKIVVFADIFVHLLCTTMCCSPD